MSNLTEKMRSLPDFYSMSKVSTEDILFAEHTLGVEFAKDYKEYIQTFGVISAGGHEFTGICRSKRLNVVQVTVSERENNPKAYADWYVLEQANIDGIVIWQSTKGEIFQTGPASNCCKIADSLEQYIDTISY